MKETIKKFDPIVPGKLTEEEKERFPGIAPEKFEQWELDVVKLRRLGMGPKKIVAKAGIRKVNGELITGRDIEALGRTKRYRDALTISAQAGQANLQQMLESMMSKALLTIEQLLTDEKSQVRLAAAQDILDRGGLKAMQVKGQISLGHVSGKQMLEISKNLNVSRNLLGGPAIVGEGGENSPDAGNGIRINKSITVMMPAGTIAEVGTGESVISSEDELEEDDEQDDMEDDVEEEDEPDNGQDEKDMEIEDADKEKR